QPRQHSFDSQDTAAQIVSLARGQVVAVLGHDQVMLELTGRSERDAQESRQIGLCSAAAPLGYVGANRDRALSHLGCETKQLVARKTSSGEIHPATEMPSLSPRLKFPEVLHDPILRRLLSRRGTCSSRRGTLIRVRAHTDDRNP